MESERDVLARSCFRRISGRRRLGLPRDGANAIDNHRDRVPALTIDLVAACAEATFDPDESSNLEGFAFGRDFIEGRQPEPLRSLTAWHTKAHFDYPVFARLPDLGIASQIPA